MWWDGDPLPDTARIADLEGQLAASEAVREQQAEMLRRFADPDELQVLANAMERAGQAEAELARLQPEADRLIGEAHRQRMRGLELREEDMAREEALERQLATAREVQSKLVYDHLQVALMTIKARAGTVIDEWEHQPEGREAWFTQNAYAVADDALRAYDEAALRELRAPPAP